jgi:integrase
MAATRHPTKTTGVRCKLHPTRRHGVHFDKYFSIRYRVDGKLREEGLGWSSEGWSEKKAAAVLAELKGNITTSTGPRTLAEKRKIENDRRKEIERQERKTAENEDRAKKLILDNVFLQYCETNIHKKSLKDEIGYFKNWISPAIGQKRLDEIVLFDLERIRASMAKAGRAARSIQYVKSIVRQVFHYAVKHRVYSGDIPTTHFLERQKIDNKRQRYLSPEESAVLLDDIKNHSLTTYRISLLSLNSGMRFSEIAGLQWQHINTTTGEILIIDPKNGETRTTYMTQVIVRMFEEMQQGRPDSLIFPAINGKQMVRISNVFQESVDRLGLNDGMTDRRLKLCFHSLRHSCASTLANSGVEIPVIAKILGHKTLSMTMRYSHINDSSVKDAMAILDQHQERQTEKKVIKIGRN